MKVLTYESQTALFFTMIGDSRWDVNAKEELEKLQKKMEETLKKLPVKYNIKNKRQLFFGDNEQWRVDFYVIKYGKITWDKIYQEVNGVKPVKFTFVKIN